MFPQQKNPDYFKKPRKIPVQYPARLTNNEPNIDIDRILSDAIDKINKKHSEQINDLKNMIPIDRTEELKKYLVSIIPTDKTEELKIHLSNIIDSQQRINTPHRQAIRDIVKTFDPIVNEKETIEQTITVESTLKPVIKSRKRKEPLPPFPLQNDLNEIKNPPHVLDVKEFGHKVNEPTAASLLKKIPPQLSLKSHITNDGDDMPSKLNL